MRGKVTSGSHTEDISAFSSLQQQLKDQFCTVFEDDKAAKAVIVIPSLTLDHQILSKIKGHFYYEERMLCMLMLLKMPATRLTFVTSLPISRIIVDYYLHMLPGITSHHAGQRLTMLSCYDAGSVPLTDKILRRPRLINRIRESTKDDPAHLVFFNVTESERSLALKLGMPIYGCDPELNHLGTKSGSRKLFMDCGISLPKGYEDLKDENDIILALFRLKTDNPGLQKAVIKMENGFSGDGNAIFNYKNAPEDHEELWEWLYANLRTNVKVVARKLSFAKFINKFRKTGGIVEEFITGKAVFSPSVQVRIDPCGGITIISTHDQVLGGEGDQVYLGATFPANPEYARDIAQMSYRLAEKLQDLGVLGRFGIDYMSVRDDDNIWKHYAIEINLRKGGTTHPFLMLQFLTNGTYNADKGTYELSDGTPRYYYATDNLQKESYKGLTPLDLIDIAMFHGLHYDHAREEGVMFHLISALSQFGKLGLLSIGKTPESAREFYNKVIGILDKETSVKAV